MWLELTGFCPVHPPKATESGGNRFDLVRGQGFSCQFVGIYKVFRYCAILYQRDALGVGEDGAYFCALLKQRKPENTRN